jgi:hypothetical protein
LDREVLKDLLSGVRRGEVGVEEALERMKGLPFEDIGFACVDHHRGLRKGLSEVIFGAGKTTEEILGIMDRMVRQDDNVLVTRLDPEKADAVQRVYRESVYHARAMALTLERVPRKIGGRGKILIVSAGTSDIPVAEEAAVTARFMGNPVETLYDVGISGLHRLLSHRERLLQAAVIVVVAGMEGALPSVVGGLVDRPVIAVPTSIGYGASLHGIAALLGMLNSCAAGVTVVNIDNGFGAGYAASVINQS